MKNKILSICIPTLNRLKELERCIESIYAQNICNELFDLIIVDGGSTDGTKEFIDEISLINNNIFFYKSINNDGVDNDILQSINLSNSDFCWLFSDDDLLSNNLLDQVIKVLSSNKSLSGMSLNYQGFDSDMLKKISTIDASRTPHISKKFNSLEDLFFDQGIHTGFISCQIINKNHFDMTYKDIKTKEQLNNWAVPYIISIAFQEKKNWYYSSDLYVYYRSGNDSFIGRIGVRKRFQLTFIGFRDILEIIFKDSNIVNKVMNHVLVTRAPRTIAFLKSKGLTFKDTVFICQMLINKYSTNPLLWIYILPLLLLPNALFYIVRKIYFKALD